MRKVSDFHFVALGPGDARNELHEGRLRPTYFALCRHDAPVGLAQRIVVIVEKTFCAAFAVRSAVKSVPFARSVSGKSLTSSDSRRDARLREVLDAHARRTLHRNVACALHDDKRHVDAT